MEKNFKDLGISPPILKALQAMGFERPTEIQEKAIPHALDKEDLVVKSKTGSGKTAVFGITMLQLIDFESGGPQGLILTPTRELAVQVDNDIKKLAKYLKHNTTAVYGQHSMNVEIEALNKGSSIVTGTPGRVFDHICQGNLVTKHIRFLVLDEADRMLDMGFMDQVVKIIRKLPQERVTMLFSATIPAEISNVCQNFMKRPFNIEIESQTMTVSTTQQVYYRVEHNEKNTWLNRLLLMERPESCIVFCNTRSRVDRVQHFLFKRGYSCRALHGDIPQDKRLKVMNQFKRGDFSLLVATDVAARGIHVDDLSLVINYDVPLEKDGYVHRIGRTGRAGSGGRAISLVTSDDIMSLYEIEEHIGVLIPQGELPTEADYNRQRAEADKWKQDSFRKIKSKRSSSGSGSKKALQKTGSTRTRRPQEPHRREQSAQSVGGANRHYNASPRVGQAHPVRQSQPQVNKARLVVASSPKTETHNVRPKQEAVQANVSAEKKPFLQHLLERIKTSFSSK